MFNELNHQQPLKWNPSQSTSVHLDAPHEIHEMILFGVDSEESKIHEASAQVELTSTSLVNIMKSKISNLSHQVQQTLLSPFRQKKTDVLVTLVKRINNGDLSGFQTLHPLSQEVKNPPIFLFIEDITPREVYLVHKYNPQIMVLSNSVCGRCI